MHIQQTAETAINMSSLSEEGFSVAQDSDAYYFGAMPMFVASLGRCTFAVMADYSMRLDISADDVSIQLNWEYARSPTRISKINMEISWPSLPESRIKAVQRAAGLCTIHNTIHHCVDVSTRVTN